jgi:hypothetical protein
MFKVQLRNNTVYQRLAKHSFFKNYVVFDISNLETIQDHEAFIQAIDHIRLSNGTYKTTSVNRFLDIDLHLVNLLKKEQSLSIHDLAVSDGSTSCELFELLEQHGFKPQIQASDKFAFLTVCLFPGIELFYDSDDKLIYGSILGIVADKRLSYRFLISKLLGYLITIFPKQIDGKRISLLSPRLKKFTGFKIQFKEADIFNETDMMGSFDVVRCMNVLNRSYFNDEKIKLALTNLKKSLRDNGLLVIGRTDVVESKNYATIFHFEQSGVGELVTFGGGAEISDLVFTVFGRVQK